MSSTRRPINRITGTAAILLAFAGLTGFASSASAETVASSATSQVAPASDPVPTYPCNQFSDEALFLRSIDEVPKPTRPSGLEWERDATVTNTTTFDGCADLSWVVVGPVGATDSSPRHIMLWHEDDYLGTATKIPYGFEPEVTRIDDESIGITYAYALPGDANANPTGSATATFTWNERTGSVDMTGDVPPAA